MSTPNKPASDTHAPVRGLGLPSPAAQTVYGVLDTEGEINSPDFITTLAPSFDWMSSIEIFNGAFRVKVGETGTLTGSRMLVGSKVPIDSDLLHPFNVETVDWHFIPFCSSKFWSGTAKMRFLALKPPRVTGKLLIRYSPDPTNNTITADTLRRGVKMEWDLGLTNEFSFEIPAFSLFKNRPTWIPRVAHYDQDASNVRRVLDNNLPIASFSLGKVEVEVAQGIQPGNIFPDSIRILTFLSFSGAEFFVPTDCRGYNRHFLSVSNNSWKIEKSS